MESKKENGWTKIRDHGVDETIIAVHKIGGYFNWRKLKMVPEEFVLFTQKSIYKMPKP